MWAKLSRDVLLWLRRRVRNHQDAEDLAGETVSRAWRRFRGEPLAWHRLWAWALVTARNLMLNYLRELRRRRFLTLDESASGPSMGWHGVAELEWCDLLRALTWQLTPGEQETLAMLQQGVWSSAAIARARGVTEREVRRQVVMVKARIARITRGPQVSVGF